jgi:hypothetical protein
MNFFYQISYKKNKMSLTKNFNYLLHMENMIKKAIIRKISYHWYRHQIWDYKFVLKPRTHETPPTHRTRRRRDPCGGTGIKLVNFKKWKQTNLWKKLAYETNQTPTQHKINTSNNIVNKFNIIIKRQERLSTDNIQ